MERLIPDPERRRLLLNQVARLIPRPRGATEQVELSGRELVRGLVRLGRSARARVRNALAQANPESLVTVRGLLREIDLDERSFIVRDPNAIGNETRCEIALEADDLLEIAKEALDHAVIARGIQRKDTTRRRAFPFVFRRSRFWTRRLMTPRFSRSARAVGPRTPHLGLKRPNHVAKTGRRQVLPP